MSEKKKKRVHQFNFKDSLLSGEAPNVSLVDSAANQTEVLVMKAKEKAVQVTLSMKEYLKQFFNLWEEDAATLAGILGYDSTTYDNYLKDDGTYMTEDEYVQSKIESVTLLKGFDELPKTIPSNIADVIKSLQDSVSLEDLNKSLKTKSGDSPSDDSNVNHTGESILEKEELDALKAKVAVMEELKKSLEDKEAVIQELLKAKEEADKAAADKLKAETLDVVKGYSFVSEEAQEGLVDALLGFDKADVLLGALESAKTAIDAAVVTEEGHAVEEEADVTKGSKEDQKLGSAVADIIKARNS